MKHDALFFQGDLVHIRLIKPDDKEPYYDSGFAHCDKEIEYYTGTTARYTQEQIYDYIDRIVRDETRYDFLILDKSKNILGEVVLNQIDGESRSANFRICLFKSSLCEKGFGTEATRLALKFAFETLALHRVELEVYSFNARALRVYSKVGFIQEGVKRDGVYLDGSYADVIIMSMLEKDYLSSSSYPNTGSD